MQKLSLVTAKVVRENEQYAYKLVGKGEKYLVLHEDGQKAEDRVISELSPFAKEPIVIDSVVVQKKSEIIGDFKCDIIFKAVVKLAYYDEISGKEKTSSNKLFVFAESAKNAISVILEEIPESHLVSISETKILDVFKYEVE